MVAITDVWADSLPITKVHYAKKLQGSWDHLPLMLSITIVRLTLGHVPIIP